MRRPPSLGSCSSSSLVGYPDVPPYPASHGCARIPMWIAHTVYSMMPDDSTVYVYQ